MRPKITQIKGPSGVAELADCAKNLLIVGAGLAPALRFWATTPLDKSHI